MNRLDTLTRPPRDNDWPIGAGTATIGLIALLLATTVLLGGVSVSAATG